MVIKNDSSREVFDRGKLLGSMLRACEKRQVSLGQLEKAVSEIEQKLQNSLEREIPSSVIGDLAMQHLKEIDEPAYVRFASVYRQFKDINSFMDELKKILESKQVQS